MSTVDPFIHGLFKERFYSGEWFLLVVVAFLSARLFILCSSPSAGAMEGIQIPAAIVAFGLCLLLAVCLALASGDRGDFGAMVSLAGIWYRKFNGP